MCMAIAIEKTTVVRGVVVACAAVALAVALTLMDWSDDGAGTFLRKIRWALNPLSVFVACELNVLITAFVVLFPVTYAQAAIDEREGVAFRYSYLQIALLVCQPDSSLVMSQAPLAL